MSKTWIFEDLTVLHDLQEIDEALSQALDALESDADLDARCTAFRRIQDLYDPPKLMAMVPSREKDLK